MSAAPELTFYFLSKIKIKALTVLTNTGDTNALRVIKPTRFLPKKTKKHKMTQEELDELERKEHYEGNFRKRWRRSDIMNLPKNRK